MLCAVIYLPKSEEPASVASFGFSHTWFCYADLATVHDPLRHADQTSMKCKQQLTYVPPEPTKLAKEIKIILENGYEEINI